MSLSPYDAVPGRRMTRRLMRGFSRTNLKAIRNAAQLSAADLARVAGVAASVIHHWEAGTRSPQVDKLDQVMRTLKIRINEVIPVDPTVRPPIDWVNMSALNPAEIAGVLHTLESPIEAVVPIPADERFPGDWRVLRGMLQPTLAAAANIPTSTLQVIERAEMNLSDKNAAALAAALGLSVDDYRSAYVRARQRPAGTPA
ncbi:putative transcriptional regulator [Mycobacteroides abscessus subsp. abscessus]|uniref:helix-turn-helix transcriptional regulator n=1 Tax=Mycobacteroides abscessus TaxID=36809 RepID=UPI00092A555E|nr:helix-turn-helix transcriptional regulator [Mycobacteroides abscessus]SIJ20983.1 putative transcriptional regulator [Mycobacteroides abscessus subsp. abscessus]SLH39409.1 putative transcriptional regulator [Mycobacteroides abscessus subsp. abscessus]